MTSASSSSSTAEATFKLATLNVHMWTDAEHEDNVERVAKLISDHDVDVACFQESDGHHDLHRFLKAAPGFKSFVTERFGTCSVVSKFPFQKYESRLGQFKSRAVTVEIFFPKPLFVSCLHFDYRREPLRLAEVAEVRKKLSDLFDGGGHQVWTGDFNALTREDYDEEEWERVSDVRRRNKWESPQVEVTGKVRDELGMVDCWERAGRPNPVKTCRFDTRIDYIFVTPAFLEEHPLVSCHHVVDPASDHNMVVAEFKL